MGGTAEYHILCTSIFFVDNSVYQFVADLEALEASSCGTGIKEICPWLRWAAGDYYFTGCHNGSPPHAGVCTTASPVVCIADLRCADFNFFLVSRRAG